MIFIPAIVGYADLTSSDLDDILKRHCQTSRFRGIRHMLNFHPDKPQYNEPSHDNYLTDPAWIKGFGLLEKYNLSFELHVLPRQMHRCVNKEGVDFGEHPRWMCITYMHISFCLLYTSPSPRDATLSRMPSSA